MPRLRISISKVSSLRSEISKQRPVSQLPCLGAPQTHLALPEAKDGLFYQASQDATYRTRALLYG